MKLRLINPNVFFLILILKQANEILTLSKTNQNKSNIDINQKETLNDNLMKINSKEILNINFSTKLEEAENNLYDNLIKTGNTINLEKDKSNQSTRNGDEIAKMNKDLNTEKNHLDYNDVIENFEETFFNNNKNINKIEEVINSKNTPNERKSENIEASNLKTTLKNKLKSNFLRNDNISISQTNQTQKIIDLIDPPAPIIPTYHIQRLETEIKLKKDKTYGQVTENVQYILKNGVFTSIIRKISLAGSSDSIIAFKVSSNDLKLKEARIINNCFEETLNQKQIKKMEQKNNYNSDNKNYSFHPYICVIAIFEEIEAKDKPMEIFIQYEYVAQNILRFREANNLMNSIVWYYDNYKRLQPMENIKFMLEISDYKLKSNNSLNHNTTGENLIAYPDKYTTDFNLETNSTVISWDFKSIPDNDYQKISIDLPMFNSKCRKLYDIQIELYSYSVLHFFLWFVIIIIFIFLIAYVYINEKEKHFSLKLSEEIRDIKLLSDQEKRLREEDKSNAYFKNQGSGIHERD